MAAYRMTAILNIEQLSGELQPTASEVEAALADFLNGQQLIVSASSGQRFEGCRIELKPPTVTGTRLGGTGC